MEPFSLCSVLEMTLKLCCIQLSHLWLLRETEVRSICLVLCTRNTIKPINNAYRVDVKIGKVCHSSLWMLLKLDMINKNDNCFTKSLYLTSWCSLTPGIRDTGKTSLCCIKPSCDNCLSTERAVVVFWIETENVWSIARSISLAWLLLEFGYNSSLL